MTVTHRDGSYEVQFMELKDALREMPDRALIVTDTNVQAAFGALLPEGTAVIEIVPGEMSKTPETYFRVIEWLADQHATRNTTVVALGGGVVGDVAGFAAATYMRGIALLQVPTTLLAQVDSSVGGKVGVDLPEGKNLLGAFHQPSEVRICVDALRSLPERHFRNGMAEVLKYGFIMEPGLLAQAAPIEGPDTEGLEPLIEACINCKRRVVEADEFETTGLRAILNFGHTVGHALEAALEYKELLHGEAISVGMYVEALISERIGFADGGTADEVRNTLMRHGLPVANPKLADGEMLLTLMRRDKKAQGSLTMSLLLGIGKCELASGLGEADVLDALQIALAHT